MERAQREHVDNLRSKLEPLACKTPEDQEIILNLDHERKLATICIKSGARNALSGRMISKLNECLNVLETWPQGKGVLLFGHGGTFCSGSDLVSVRASATQQLGLALAQVMQDTMMRLQRLPMVSVAFVEGYALGGGAELALAADLRLMTESAKIGFVHAKVGVCCGWGGGTRLVRLVGPARATDLLLSGRLVGASEAQQLGLSNGCARNQLEALQYLESNMVGPRETIVAVKAMLHGARSLAHDDSLRLEASLFASTWGKDEHIKALDRNIKHNTA